MIPDGWMLDTFQRWQPDLAERLLEEYCGTCASTGNCMIQDSVQACLHNEQPYEGNHLMLLSRQVGNERMLICDYYREDKV